MTGGATVQPQSPARQHPALTVATALRLEAAAVRRGLPTGAGAGVRVVSGGAGARRARALARRLHGEAAGGGALAVMGVGGALVAGLRPGDLVVATEVRGPDGTLACPAAELLAGALRRAGLRAVTGPMVTTARPVVGAARARLAAGGALLADMESAHLLAGAAGRPAVVVRAVVDTPDAPLASLATVPRGLAALRALRAAAPVVVAVAAAVRPDRAVLLASPQAFCAGVERAIGAVERALDGHGRPVYVRRQIVHNAHVVAGLEARGAVFVHELDEVPEGATVVFSAHGVAPAVWAEAGARRLTVVDATCPLVAKVHAEARRFDDRGDTVVLVGHAGHDEVEGTLGQLPGRMHLVQDGADVGGLDVPRQGRVSYVMQTTLATDEAAHVVDALRERFPDLDGPREDDICYATSNRQAAVRAVADDADLVLVVGSANSSNSVRLVEVAERADAPAHLVEDAAGIEPGWLAGAGCVAVTAGASAPPALVDDVVAALLALSPADAPATVRTRSVATEQVTFTLPRESRPA